MKQTKWNLIIVILASILIFNIAAFVAVSGRMTLWEENLFLMIYELPEALTPTVYLMTLLGSSWMFALLIFGAIILNKRTIALKFFVAGGITYIMFQTAKLLIERDRPMELLQDITSRDPIVSGFGFPSGHTAMATVLGLLCWSLLPKSWRWVVPVWILMVAFSRIYLGVHAPLDIVGGLAIGVVAFCLIMLVPDKTWRPKRYR